ncbi:MULTISPECIES: alpha/beta fold hydrolase [Planktothricoides]|uniref:Alpha/beta fold hydrolase n=2 Tax=Planktothricoides raciborskii TaxID=132608 RepID=A0AAU8J7Q7_9CYAN|nr:MULTISPECIES: alpha/beta fold hydrolase [Planktothricoides]KOR36008.1 alpha/beta hydrolase [Planktothricoides sp. SR001]MBD2545588.1 alpha/beta fold hydrolase [Planktothricoides raciborskii FACHB-1370]MBD2583494.1 alpha/beta fold hydrolase [Planktothricoides raciborskii FACHB-1261]
MADSAVLASAEICGDYWQWREQSIYYVRAGNRHSGRPPLLLVHGFGASTDHWRKNIQELQQDFEVWAIDLIGFGRSAKPKWVYGGELWRDQLHDFIQAQIGSPVVLAGNSLGGYASLCLAAQRPESAAGVILLNSAGPFSETSTDTSSDTPSAPKPSPVRQGMNQLIRGVFRQEWVSFLIFQWTRRRSVIRKTLEKVYLDTTAVTDRLVEEIYRPSCDPGAAGVFASVFKSPSGEKVDQLLQELNCPLLTLWGEGDPWMNVRDRSQKFRQYYPQLTEYFLKAGHCPHDEIPQQVNELIKTWVFSNCLM